MRAAITLAAALIFLRLPKFASMNSHRTQGEAAE